MRSVASAYLAAQRYAICICTLSTLAFGQWIPVESSETDASLRGVHNAGSGIIWASGTGGTVLRSEDDGFVWQKCRMPDETRNLDFRGIWAWDANHAIVMSSGPGDSSRLYETVDGGATWRLLFRNPDLTGFWDGIAFSGKEGMLVGDPVNGRFAVFHTKDLGQHWTRDDNPALNADPKREGIFAASNSSLPVRQPGANFVFATGGLSGSRLFLLNHFMFISGSNKYETQTWSSSVLTLAVGAESSGAFSTDFRTLEIGVAVGGDYKRPTTTDGTAAFTSDGGVHWRKSTKPPSGFRSAVQWAADFQCWIAVGTNGSDVSFDDGNTWQQFDRGNWNALSVPWVVGPKGQIARLDEQALKGLAASR
ncbi:MAG: WD40/YVTN/BNR-like repeat-containing protein [Bryobacteraceae bacterium]